LKTEQRHPQTFDLDRRTPESIAEAILGSQVHATQVAHAISRAVGQAAAEAAERIAAGGRLVYAGAGTSGRLATQDAAELPPTFGFDRTVVLMAGGARAGSKAEERAEDDVEAAKRHVDEAEVEARDVIIGVAASGSTPYTCEVLRQGRERGALVIAIANNPGTPLLELADHPLLVDTGPEVLTGSTRMAAGTAQKAVLNALSTTMQVQLGEVFSNLMVGMKPTNRKLELRAVRMVQDATQCSEAQAKEALEQSGNDIKVAVVMTLADLTADAARARLAASGGHVRTALEGVQAV